MATVTNAGVASGNDFESIITASVSARKQQLQKKVTVKQAELDIQKDGLNTLKSALKSFKSSCDKLTEANSMNVHTITTSQSSDYQAFSITANSDCANTSFSMVVNQLASAEKISQTFDTSEGSGFKNSFSAGTLTIDLGDETYTDDSGHEATRSRSFTVEISEGDTLELIRKRINSNEYGVSCNLVQGSNGYTMSLSSDTTGATATNLSITVDPVDSEDTDDHDSLWSAFTFSSTTDSDGNKVAPEGSAWSYTAGKDAIITVDGLEITSDTNVFEDQVSGVTITAKKVSETETNDDGTTGLKSYDVDIASDVNSATSKMQSFITAYNSLMSTMNTLYSRNTYTDGSNNYDGGDLAGDSQLKAIQTEMQRMISQNDSSSGNVNLFTCGLSYEQDGTLSLDSTKFKEALNTSFNAVTSLFTDEDGLLDKMSEYVNDYTKSSGILDNRLTQVNDEASYWKDKETRNEEILSAYEASLRKKYANLDSLMAGYNTSMSYLSSVLSGISAG